MFLNLHNSYTAHWFRFFEMYHTIFLLRQLTWLAVISLLTSNAIANKVGFEINHTVAKSSGLEISSKQLKLAKEVI